MEPGQALPNEASMDRRWQSLSSCSKPCDYHTVSLNSLQSGILSQLQAGIEVSQFIEAGQVSTKSRSGKDVSNI